MTLGQRFKKCTKDMNVLFKKSIGPLVVFLFFYYLITKIAIFPLGRLIWSNVLKLLPDGYIGLNNIKDVFTHPSVLIVAILLVIIYAIISYLQIECVFIFVEYRYNDKEIGFSNLVKDVWVRSRKVSSPRNWMMLVFAMLIIPFVNLFQLSNDFGGIAIPEYIFTVILQRKPLLFAYVALILLLLYIVLKGMYVFITFPCYDNSYKEAYRHSAKLTRGAGKKFLKLIGIALARLAAILLFYFIPYMLLTLVQVLSKKAFGSAESFAPALELMKNMVAFPAISSFCSAMSCALVISLIIIWFHTDTENAGEATPELKDYPNSDFVSRLIKFFSAKALVIIVFIAVTLYFVSIPLVSSILNKNPELVSRYAMPTGIIAHKGYTSKAPENTLPALDVAIECGNVDIVEFDVQASKDGVPVVIHDRNAAAITGVNKDICDMTVKEIKKLDAGSNSKKYKGTRIPTLEEYLQHCDHRIMLLLEIKNYNKDPNLEKEVMKLLEKYDYLDGSCLIHSGSVDSLKKVKAINPDIMCGLIMTVAIGTFYDLPYADFFSIESSFINLQVVNGIHSRYKFVFAWTVDEQDVVEYMYSSDADGIICDDPNLVKSYLDEYAGNMVDYSSRRVEKYLEQLAGESQQQLDTEYGD